MLAPTMDDRLMTARQLASYLSLNERTVLEAHLRLGKSAPEIASELGTTTGAVRMQIHSGLERLRAVLPRLEIETGLALSSSGSR